MNQNTEILLSVRRMIKLYELCLKNVCEAYHLTQIEVNIISFLHNNPEKDTAGDISEIRMLPKGNVSQGVEALIQKSLLYRTPDKRDRRYIHLSLTSEALPLIMELEKARKQFLEQIFDGFSPEECRQYMTLNERIINNTIIGLERKQQ
ncbi:MarR family winged helix-turn-helix transcriptional regulator [Qiania dongpingensis]|uniref:MarR family transcriptional regulator n=1 Tax=Qiania dongpingensis TaxID=2763669 RepID=A0A7G9G5V2_9FIRM|nr:MarR family transcriptional regulator [Qiania dongpingensis]QNM06184.1 MarR family transcriptional regulator [Qiania dongpingensis]